VESLISRLSRPITGEDWSSEPGSWRWRTEAHRSGLLRGPAHACAEEDRL